MIEYNLLVLENSETKIRVFNPTNGNLKSLKTANYTSYRKYISESELFYSPYKKVKTEDLPNLYKGKQRTWFKSLLATIHAYI